MPCQFISRGIPGIDRKLISRTAYDQLYNFHICLNSVLCTALLNKSALYTVQHTVCRHGHPKLRSRARLYGTDLKVQPSAWRHELHVEQPSHLDRPRIHHNPPGNKTSQQCQRRIKICRRGCQNRPRSIILGAFLRTHPKHGH